MTRKYSKKLSPKVLKTASKVTAEIVLAATDAAFDVKDSIAAPISPEILKGINVGKIRAEIADLLQRTQEQAAVVGPLVEYLCTLGWELGQIQFGRKEWRVPKSPSEATKREKGNSFLGFPVDIAVFDSPQNIGTPEHLIFLVECKQPTETAGVSQLEGYFVGEPHAHLGVWTNSPDPAAKAAFIYRRPNGSMLLKRRSIVDLPRPGEAIVPESRGITYADTIPPSERLFRTVIEDILDKVVIGDANVTRREEQLDQVCNVVLLKLESDKQARANPTAPVMFRPMESHARTAAAMRKHFEALVDVYPETFVTQQDKSLRLTDDSLAACVEALSGLRMIELGVSTVSVAFQVLRSEALKQNEGQYFTPLAVVEAGVRLLNIQLGDLVIDPACGTGGFLVQTLLDIQRRYPNMSEADLSKWAQTHIFGIEKDAIGLKVTKAIMQIAGDGSAHCARGDSVRTHKWTADFPHLTSGTFRNGRFTVVLTNPPFGQNLKVSAKDSRLSGLDVAQLGTGEYEDLEIGLLFLQRAHQLLRTGGRVGIVLPETYFFSYNYKFLWEWLRPRLRPTIVANVPMEAFQGFCRAKTNFYVFEKV
jgi:type I restriction enzyme M protein